MGEKMPSTGKILNGLVGMVMLATKAVIKVSLS